MPMLMRTVPEELAQLAGSCDTCAIAIEDAQLLAHEALALRSRAAGNSPGGAEFVQAALRALESVDAVLGRFTGVLESDMDDLYETAFDFSTVDEQAAVSFTAAGRKVGP